MSEHLCHATGCKTAVPPRIFMCRRHWAMVPTPLRFALIRNYRRGQCDDKQVSKEWLAAALAIRSYVAAQEGR